MRERPALCGARGHAEALRHVARWTGGLKFANAYATGDGRTPMEIERARGPHCGDWATWRHRN